MGIGRAKNPPRSFKRGQDEPRSTRMGQDRPEWAAAIDTKGGRLESSILMSIIGYKTQVRVIRYRFGRRYTLSGEVRVISYTNIRLNRGGTTIEYP